MIAHDENWTGAIDRFDGHAIEFSPDLGDLTIGNCRMTVQADGYRVSIDLPENAIQGEVHFAATSEPFVVRNEPAGDGRISWLFVPRLRATGWLHIGGRQHRFADDLAYHDHNWGRFRWGDDFGWTWGTILPTAPEDPWSMVFVEITDRNWLRSVSRSLYVWRHDEPVAIFRHAAVQTHSIGRLSRPADCTLPRRCGCCSTERFRACRSVWLSPRHVRAIPCTPSSIRVPMLAWRSRAKRAQTGRPCCVRPTGWSG